MKKALLLSVVASVAVMAGGDIAPAPVVAEEVSAWDFSGQAVAYYQTRDNDNDDLFSQDSGRANVGLQLRAVNKDIWEGIGAGGEVSGLGTWGLEDNAVKLPMQAASGTANDDGYRGGWISQAYMTYGFGNTSFKGGRQELPKALSPFAFSENWNVFKNTFDSILVVNTDISNTTIVGAWVYAGNQNNLARFDSITGDTLTGDMSDFNPVNGGAGIYMLTVQNKSIENLTLTGSWYYATDYLHNLTHGAFDDKNDANILWGDAKYVYDNYLFAGQIGAIWDDDFSRSNGFASGNDTVAGGAMASGHWGNWDASLIYSGVNDGGVGVFNVGGVKTPLYSQLILNQNYIRYDNNTFVGKAGVNTEYGRFSAAYDYTDSSADLIGDYQEFDLVYKVKVFNDTTTLFAAYVYTDEDDFTLEDGTKIDPDSQNMIRFWARYNF